MSSDRAEMPGRWWIGSDPPSSAGGPIALGYWYASLARWSFGHLAVMYEGKPYDWILMFQAPHWLLILVAGTPLVAWGIGRIRRSRRSPGDCLKCGYDLRGLAAGAVCPECGGAAGAYRAKA